LISRSLIYKIVGKVKDDEGNPVPNLFVEAFDSDNESSADYLANTYTDSQGNFTLTFDDKAFRELLEIFEWRPDIYIVLRDSYRILYKSEIRTEAKDLEVFDIILKDTRPIDDPYANTLQRVIASFNSISDTVDISQIYPQRSIRQMIRALTNWSYYTTPKIMELYGYPGPQVPKYSKRVQHNHSLPWNKGRTN
jgi:hypothetical protein